MILVSSLGHLLNFTVIGSFSCFETTAALVSNWLEKVNKLAAKSAQTAWSARLELRRPSPILTDGGAFSLLWLGVIRAARGTPCIAGLYSHAPMPALALLLPFGLALGALLPQLPELLRIVEEAGDALVAHLEALPLVLSCQICALRPPQRLGSRSVGAEPRPFRVGQIACVAQPLALLPRTSLLRRPLAESSTGVDMLVQMNGIAVAEDGTRS